MTAAAGDPLGSSSDEPEPAPTEAEALQARQQIWDEAKAALSRLEQLRIRPAGPPTWHELVPVLMDLDKIHFARTMDWVILHVQRRAVLRTEAALFSQAAKALQPIWRGSWREDQSYPKAALVQFGQALWISEYGTVKRPGTPGSGWRLAVKSPR